MLQSLHPAAPHVLPPFVTAPGETDILLVMAGMSLFLTIVGIGVFYFRLHALPERMAHNNHKIQFEIVAVLGLLALFTHNHLFWIAGLLLAMVSIPDFRTPLVRIAGSLERISRTMKVKDEIQRPSMDLLPSTATVEMQPDRRPAELTEERA